MAIMLTGKIGNKDTVWEASLPLRDDTRTTGEIDSTRGSIGPNGTIGIADLLLNVKSINSSANYRFT